MMWRGVLISSLLHGGLLVGLVGTLPILPEIFDRSVDTASTGLNIDELQIAVDVVSAATLRQLTEVAGIRDTAPDTETVVPAPRLTVGLSLPKAASAKVLPDTPVSKPVPSPAAPKPSPQQPPVPRERTEASRPAPATQQRAAAIPVPPITRAESSAESAPSASTREAQTASTQQDAAESEFIRAVSGRKRNLVVEVLRGDARMRRAVTPQTEPSNIPEQARDRTLARLNKAAQAGFAHAQYNLAGKYLRGEDVPKDTANAQKWLTRAAEQGYAPAQSLLALMRLTGKGTGKNAEPDVAEAAFWWSLAAEAGNPGAKLASERLKPLLKPQEHVRAQRLRARWGNLINDLADLSSGETSRRDLDRALQTAAEKGDLDAVLSLLARGADADQSGDAGRNAVINAAWRGRQRIIMLLLERGVATELPDDDGRTPLIWAAINGHDTVVQDLVASGANPNKKDRDGSTALIRAAWNGHTTVVSQLIGAGANVNIQDNNGLTALAHAQRERNTAVIRLLQAAGAR